MKKRIMSWLVVFTMLLTMLPMTALAAEAKSAKFYYLANPLGNPYSNYSTYSDSIGNGSVDVEGLEWVGGGITGLFMKNSFGPNLESRVDWPTEHTEWSDVYSAQVF